MTWHSLDCRIEMRPVDQLQAIIDEMRHGLASVRHQMYFEKGTTCVTCGRAATHVIAWREKRYADAVGFKGLHVDLISVADNGRETLMTADHIIPKSKGGPKTVENFQPMCSPCNQAKADTVPEGWVDERDPKTLTRNRGGLKEETERERAARQKRNRARRARRARAKMRMRLGEPDTRLMDLCPPSLLVADSWDAYTRGSR